MGIDIDGSTPPSDELKPLARIAKLMKVDVSVLHRWRLEVDHPLACWLIDRRWHTTLVAVRDHIRRRTTASRERHQGTPTSASPSPSDLDFKPRGVVEERSEWAADSTLRSV